MKDGLPKPNTIPSTLIALLFVLLGRPVSGDQPYLSEVRLFALDFCPTNWLEADGRELSVSEHMELFATWGNSYGGDGIMTLALPDLRGRVPLGVGAGPGLSRNRQGQKGGLENVALDPQQLPQHGHVVTGNEGPGSSKAALAAGTEDEGEVVAGPVQESGADRPHGNRPPYLAMRYCVAVKGEFPTRY